ncbi:MAG: hypothetical protein IRZ26_02085 [Clostridia bacterium]|nr:hypothetical protein [Clostridia bacterium]
MRIVTVPELEAELGRMGFRLSRFRIWELIREGVLPPGVAVFVGRRRYVDLDGFIAWLQRGGTAQEKAGRSA